MAPPETLSLRLSYELANIVERGEFLRAASEAVGALLPADSVEWVGTHLRTGQVEIHSTGDSGRPAITEALSRVLPIHPMMVSYQAQPEDSAPRRMSDLIPLRDWTSHQAYAELFVPLGAVHQLAITVKPLTDGAWMGWGFNRKDRDFTGDELAAAALLQPTLIALNQASCLAFGQHTSAQSQARDRAALTAREGDILDLLASGLTATAIGHVCRISPATVRKHLEHIYAKLGCSDRLLAVERARRLGLLPRART
jgi:DNA-binding CsgD family transcriptional regulator